MALDFYSYYELFLTVEKYFEIQSLNTPLCNPAQPTRENRPRGKFRNITVNIQFTSSVQPLLKICDFARQLLLISENALRMST